MENKSSVFGAEAKLKNIKAIGSGTYLLGCDSITKKRQAPKPKEEAPKREKHGADEENSKGGKVAKAFKIILEVLLFTVIIAIILKVCQADHKELTALYVTDELKEVYESSTDLRTHVAGTEFSENGAIYAYSFVYNEQNGYMQLTVRYNENHLDEVVDSLNTHAQNGKSYTTDDIEIFYVIKDSNGITYTPTVLDTAEKYEYHYFKLEVCEVDFTADSLSIYMMLNNVAKAEINEETVLVYSAGQSTDAGSVLTFHEKSDTYIEYKLSKNEKSNLE